jgi:RNA-directed DNA polymerase
LDSSFCERPSPNPEDTVSEQNPASSTIRPRKKKVHSLIDKVFSRQNLELAWSRVKKNRGSAGIDNVTITVFELRQSYYLDSIGICIFPFPEVPMTQ